MQSTFTLTLKKDKFLLQFVNEYQLSVSVPGVGDADLVEQTKYLLHTIAKYTSKFCLNNFMQGIDRSRFQDTFVLNRDFPFT